MTIKLPHIVNYNTNQLTKNGMKPLQVINVTHLYGTSPKYKDGVYIYIYNKFKIYHYLHHNSYTLKYNHENFRLETNRLNDIIGILEIKGDYI